LNGENQKLKLELRNIKHELEKALRMPDKVREGLANSKAAQEGQGLGKQSDRG
jgi:hypothetical protein